MSQLKKFGPIVNYANFIFHIIWKLHIYYTNLNTKHSIKVPTFSFLENIFHPPLANVYKGNSTARARYEGVFKYGLR